MDQEHDVDKLYDWKLNEVIVRSAGRKGRRNPGDKRNCCLSSKLPKSRANSHILSLEKSLIRTNQEICGGEENHPVELTSLLAY